MSANDLKRQAAERALALVVPGMKLGLGTGSTAAMFVELLAVRVSQGLDVQCVPTSEATAAQARRRSEMITRTTAGSWPGEDCSSQTAMS